MVKRPMRRYKVSAMPNGHRVTVDTVRCQWPECHQTARWCVYRRWGVVQRRTMGGTRGGIAFDYYCDVHWTTPLGNGISPKQHAEKRS